LVGRTSIGGPHEHWWAARALVGRSSDDGADVDGPAPSSDAALLLERADVGDEAVDILVGE